jgi:dTDP-4-dehydrorhamnose 3,5-epimerase-like enzyme
MAYLIDLPTFSEERGSLTVIEKVLPFEIKRVYYIYNATQKRGGHRHKKTWQALISVAGSCQIYVNNGREENIYILDKPDKCLVLAPEDWHTMDNFSSDCVLLVLASEYYDPNDYINEVYK